LRANIKLPPKTVLWNNKLNRDKIIIIIIIIIISKGLPPQAEVAQGVPARLRPLNFLDVSALQGW